jgi:hypothetical protein
MNRCRLLPSGTLLLGWLSLAGMAVAQRPAGDSDRQLATMTIGRLHYDGGGDWYANPCNPDRFARLHSGEGGAAGG